MFVSVSWVRDNPLGKINSFGSASFNGNLKNSFYAQKLIIPAYLFWQQTLWDIFTESWPLSSSVRY